METMPSIDTHIDTASSGQIGSYIDNTKEIHFCLTFIK